MEDHVDWPTPMGARVLINDGWYYTQGWSPSVPQGAGRVQTGQRALRLADKIMEGLATLSPRCLQKLRLQEHQRHAPTGKRMLGPGGRLDPTYLITVPEELYARQ